MTQLRSNRSLPEALAEDLGARIQAGEWLPGEQMPTEQALVAQTGVSRSTVRSALGILVSRGLIHVRQGSGTFVRRRGPGVATGLQELRSTTELISSQRGDCEVVYRLVEQRPATQQEAAQFDTEPPFDILAIERCFVSHGEAVAFEWALLNVGLLPPSPEPRHFSGSIFAYLEPLGLKPTDAVATIRASQREISWEGYPTQSDPYLCLTQQAFLRTGEVITASQTYFVEGIFEFLIMRSS